MRVAVPVKAGHERDNEHSRVESGENFFALELEEAEIGNHYGQAHGDQRGDIYICEQDNQHGRRQQAVGPPECPPHVQRQPQGYGEEERHEQRIAWPDKAAGTQAADVGNLHGHGLDPIWGCSPRRSV